MFNQKGRKRQHLLAAVLFDFAETAMAALPENRRNSLETLAALFGASASIGRRLGINDLDVANRTAKGVLDRLIGSGAMPSLPPDIYAQITERSAEFAGWSAVGFGMANGCGPFELALKIKTGLLATTA